MINSIRAFFYSIKDFFRQWREIRKLEQTLRKLLDSDTARIVTDLPGAGKEWRRDHPQKCPVFDTEDGAGIKGICNRALKEGRCPLHGKIYE